MDDQEKFFKLYMSIVKAAKQREYDITDAFSNGQIESKIWLIRELEKVSDNLGNVWTLCGWIGTLAYLIKNTNNRLIYNNIRSFDIDDRCAGLSEILNKDMLLNNWKFKSSTIDVNSMRFTDYKFPTLKSDGSIQYIQESANTVINTSCDHMDKNIWWERVPTGTLVVLQNNNFATADDHVNTVTSIREFKNKYPMHELLFEGELECDLYTRFMLIGKK